MALSRRMGHQPDKVFADTQSAPLAEVRWKRAMHLRRVPATEAASLGNSRLAACVDERYERSVLLRRGEMPWSEAYGWRKKPHRDFKRALAKNRLPGCSDRGSANRSSKRAPRRNDHRQR